MLLPYLPISYVFSFFNDSNTISERQSILVSTFSFFSLWPLCSYTFWLVYIPFVLTDCDRNVVKAKDRNPLRARTDYDTSIKYETQQVLVMFNLIT